MRAKLSTWLAAFTLLEWGGILIYFCGSGRIASYLHPFFQPWLLLAGILIGITGGVIFFSGAEGCAHIESDCCEHHPSGKGGDPRKSGDWRTWGRALVLGVPVAVAGWVSPDHFSGVFAQNRPSISLPKELPGSFVPSPAVTEPDTFLDHPKEEISFEAATSMPSRKTSQDLPHYREPAKVIELMDLIYTAGIEEDRDRLEGQVISVIGQVSLDQSQGFRPGNLGIYRLIIVCCAADARPVSIRVDAQGLDPRLKNSDWVKATGKIHFIPDDHSSVLIIQRAELTPVAVPQDDFSSP